MIKSPEQLRIVYMGTPQFAVPALRMLVEKGYNVAAVVTAPDKPAGRGLTMQQSAVKEYALEAGLPVMQPEKLKDPDFVEAFRALDADMAIVIAFRMLPEVIWNAPRLGTFNLHASLLPQYRGAAPINWALINGEKHMGLTTFMLDDKIDNGAIIARCVVDIEEEDTLETLHDRLMMLGPGLVEQTIGIIASGEVHPIAQDSISVEELRAAPKIYKEDCLIRWNKPGKQIRNLIRGLSPYPAAWSWLCPMREDIKAEGVQVKIFAAQFFPAMHGCIPGEIFTDGKTYIKAATPDGYLLITDLQVAGKKRMQAADFLRGFHNMDGYGFRESSGQQ